MNRPLRFLDLVGSTSRLTGLTKSSRDIKYSNLYGENVYRVFRRLTISVRVQKNEGSIDGLHRVRRVRVVLG